jgi:uncharacterized protein YceK
MIRPLHLVAAVGSTLLTSGCATIAGGGATTQGVSVQTIDSQGAAVNDARCEMSNDEGRWFVTSPGSVTIHRSNKDLLVTCRKPGQEDSTATVVSRTKGSLWGNLLVGGGVGAIIDHNNGSAYEYPPFFWMVMGVLGVTIDQDSRQTKPVDAPDTAAAAAP